jgi:hypothetical protein
MLCRPLPCLVILVVQQFHCVLTAPVLFSVLRMNSKSHFARCQLLAIQIVWNLEIQEGKGTFPFLLLSRGTLERIIWSVLLFGQLNQGNHIMKLKGIAYIEVKLVPNDLILIVSPLVLCLDG